MRRRSLLMGMMSVWSLTWLAGCGDSSAGTTLPSGRSVTTHSDSMYLSSSSTRDTATITSGTTKVVLSPTQLLIDDRPVATLNANAKNVDVTIKRGQVTLVADGQTIVTDVK